MIKLKKIIKKIKKTVFSTVVMLDGLFLIGTIILIATNFIVNQIFGMYSLSLFFIAFSVYMSNTKQQK